MEKLEEVKADKELVKMEVDVVRNCYVIASILLGREKNCEFSFPRFILFKAIGNQCRKIASHSGYDML